MKLRIMSKENVIGINRVYARQHGPQDWAVFDADHTPICNVGASYKRRWKIFDHVCGAVAPIKDVNFLSLRRCLLSIEKHLEDYKQ